MARQLQSFQEALKQHFGVGRLAEELPPPNAGNPAEGLEHVSPGLTTTGARQQNSRQQVHGASIMDLGLDAINKVGQTINNFADRVDTTIEHWIESFQSLEDLQRFLDSGSPQHQVRADQARQPSGNSSIGSPTRVKPQAATSPTGSRSAQHRPAKSPIGAFLDAKQTLEEEVAYREAEQARLQEECRRLHAELRYAANKCSALSEENSLLRLREVDELSPVPRSTEHHHSAMAGDPDPLTDLMARQLETLLAEKAKLAQENARLARENNTLHDMLTFSMASMEEEDGASDSVIDEPDSWVTVGNSAVAVA